MSYRLTAGVAALIDLAGRLMLTHAIAPEHAMRVLGLSRAEVVGMIDTGLLTCPFTAEQGERLQLFVNLLLRLEWRFGHDGRAIRRALETPLDALGGSSLGDNLDGDLAKLRLLRRLVDEVEAPRVRWWRVGH